MKNKILLVGQNPNRHTGNGILLTTCLQEIDYEKNEFCVFTIEDNPIDESLPIFQKLNKKYTSIYTNKHDLWGKQQLLQILNAQAIDQLIFVGLDLWRYYDIFKEIKIIQNKNKFAWKTLIPYDLDYLNEYWLNMMDLFDQVYTYTFNGYELIKKDYPSIKYFRPNHPHRTLYKALAPKEKQALKQQVFPNEKDKTIFFFIGNNQIRKNIYNTIVGFSNAIAKNPNLFLYIHTDNLYQVFNLENLIRRNNIPETNIKISTKKYSPQKLAIMYSAMDCHVLFSLQEGLSLSVLESKLAGIPSLLSYTTSHKDFVHSSITHVVPTEMQFHPTIIENTPEYVATPACSVHQICQSFLEFGSKKPALRTRKYIDHWFNNCNNFNEIIDDQDYEKKKQAKGIIL